MTCRSSAPEGACGCGGRDPYTLVPNHDGVLLCFDSLPSPSTPNGGPPTGRTWTHTTIAKRSQMRMLLSFQRPPGLPRGASPRGRPTDPTPEGTFGPTSEYSAPSSETWARPRLFDKHSAPCGQTGRRTPQTGRPAGQTRGRARQYRGAAPGRKGAAPGRLGTWAPQRTGRRPAGQQRGRAGPPSGCRPRRRAPSPRPAGARSAGGPPSGPGRRPAHRGRRVPRRRGRPPRARRLPGRSAGGPPSARPRTAGR